MIKLTETQKQTATALAKLTKARPQTMFFTVEEVRNVRLYAIGKDVKNQAYLRTTKTALKQLHMIVPTLTTFNAVGWRLTDVGKVMARSQLGVEV
jgi:hypothetical protein